MRIVRNLVLLGFLGGVCVEAQVNTYTSPLGDQAYVTEALWDMDAVTKVDVSGQSHNVVSDKNTANPSRHHDLVLYGPTLGESNHPPFQKSLVFNGAGDYAASYSTWYKDRAGVVVELWVWINNNQNPGPVYLASASFAWRLFLTNNGSTVNFQVFPASPGFKSFPANPVNTIISASIAKQTWRHIRAEFSENSSNQGQLSLEVSDGLTVTSSAPPGIAANNKLHIDDHRVYLGSDTDGTSCYRGELDDIRITSQNVPSAAERGKDMVESFFLDTDPNMNDAGNLPSWCLSVLWLYTLGSSHPIVTSADVTLALSKLALLTDSRIFAQIPPTRPIDDSKDPAIYWELLSLVRILNQPRIVASLSDQARISIETILSNFVRERDIALSEAESNEGAIWSVYKSMNHDWLQKATYLLTAQYFKNTGTRIDYADGLTSSQHYDLWVKHLKAKLQQMAARGIDPEIASPGYVSITLNALFAIRDNAQDAQLSLQAEKFINLLLGDAAAESFHGVRGGSKTRCYRGWDAEGLWQAGDADADFMGMWTHLLVNDPVIMPRGETDRHAVGSAMSSSAVGPAMSPYAVPPVVSNLMLSTNKNFFHASRRPAKGYHDDTQRSNRNPFYHFQFPSDLRRSTFGTPEYIMGSFALLENVPLSYYSQLTRIDQWMGLITSGGRYSRAFFQAGDNSDSTTSMNSLSAIQWPGNNPTRPGECAMLIKCGNNTNDSDVFLLLSDDFRANLVFPTADTDNNNWIFSRNADSKTYLAVKDVGATSPGYYTTRYVPEEHGMDARVDFNSSVPIVAVEVAPASAYSSFDEFKSDVMDNVFSWNGSYARYVSSGGVTLTMPKDGSGSTVNGSPYPGNISKTYSGEYLSNSVYDSPVITLKDPANNALVLDFTHAGYAIDPDWNELAYDDFEGGFGNYTCNLPDCSIDHDPANAHQGRYFPATETSPSTTTSQSVKLESYSHSSVLDLTTGLDLAAKGYNQFKVEFWYRPVDMELGESFALQYSIDNGSNWTTIAYYFQSSAPSAFAFVNGPFRYSSVVRSSSPAGFGSQVKIRFKCQGSDASDNIFIDQVKISARTK